MSIGTYDPELSVVRVIKGHDMANVKSIVDALLETPKKIPEGYKHNFSILEQAIKEGDAVLIMATEKKTGQDIAVVCALNRASQSQFEDGPFELVPIAKLFSGNPHDELEDPTQEDLPRGETPAPEDFA